MENKTRGKRGNKDSTKHIGSLTEPNFDGLWSTVHLKRSGSFTALKKLRGAFVLLCLTLSWCLGVAVPLVALYLMYTAKSFPYLATFLAILVAHTYVIPYRRIPAVARFWLLASEYFDGGASFSFETERIPNDFSVPQMQCYHPHGIFTLGLIINSGFRSVAANADRTSEHWKKYVGEKVGQLPSVGLAARTLVNLPVFNLIMVKWTGCIESADKEHMVFKMKNHHPFGLMPGGFHEAALFVQGKERAYVGKTGFIYYALKYGYMVVPAYTFGESGTYFNLPGFERLRKRLSDQGVPTIFVTGPFFFVPLLALLPFGTGGLHTVLAQGRQFPQIDEPTPEQVNEYHNWYCKALKELYERNKHRFGVTADLEIIYE